MARGFESKGVADQQQEDFSAPPAADEREPPARARQRRSLELARADVQSRLRAAPSESHRALLERSLQAIDEQLTALAAPPG